jgi:drug/metabolite transporter (DMT)-like permease
LTPRLSPRAEESPSRFWVIAAFAAIYLFWGCTFLAIRYAVAEVPPLLTIAFRCVGGALLLYAWLWWRGGLEPATRSQWLTSAIAGAFLFLGGHGVLAWAEQRVASGQAALFMACIPLWLVLLVSVRERRVPAVSVIAGLVLGTFGVGLLARGNGEWAGTLLDRLALVGCGLSWAVGSIVARDGARPASAIQSTAMQLAAGGVLVIAISLASGELAGWSPAQITSRGTLALLFLLLAGTVLGFGAYTWLLRVTTPAAVGTYAFVNPVIALMVAWAVGDEPFSTRTVLAAAIVLGAVVLIWRSSAMPRTVASHARESAEILARAVSASEKIPELIARRFHPRRCEDC